MEQTIDDDFQLQFSVVFNDISINRGLINDFKPDHRYFINGTLMMIFNKLSMNHR